MKLSHHQLITTLNINVVISRSYGLFDVMQANILARFKPKIDIKLLIPTLDQADKMIADALKYFNDTRHMVLYYEDLVRDHTVSSLSFPAFSFRYRLCVICVMFLS